MSTGDDALWGDEKFKRFIEERRDLNATRIKQVDDFDRSVLTLSSAGIGLSIALLRFGVTGAPQGLAAWALALSWVLFTAALVFITLSFRKSATLHYKEMQIIQDIFQGGDEADQKNPHEGALVAFNSISMWSFLGGVVSLVVFAFITLLH